MKVKEIMTADPRICTPDTTVAAAANLMWEGDCGILPVVDEGELVGVVTTGICTLRSRRETRVQHS